MKIYKMVFITKEESFLCSHKSEKNYWALTAEENSKIVHSREECNRYNTLYAIEYDTEKMSLEYLMDIMYKQMSVEEVKTICNSHEKLEQFFVAYLSGEKTRKDLAKLRKSIKSAQESAESALVMSLLD